MSEEDVSGKHGGVDRHKTLSLLLSDIQQLLQNHNAGNLNVFAIPFHRIQVRRRNGSTAPALR